MIVRLFQFDLENPFRTMSRPRPGHLDTAALNEVLGAGDAPRPGIG